MTEASPTSPSLFSNARRTALSTAILIASECARSAGAIGERASASFAGPGRIVDVALRFNGVVNGVPRRTRGRSLNLTRVWSACINYPLEFNMCISIYMQRGDGDTNVRTACTKVRGIRRRCLFFAIVYDVRYPSLPSRHNGDGSK